MKTLITFILTVFAMNATAEVEVKKVDTDRKKMIENKYIGTGVGEKKAEEDAKYGVKQNISELGAGFDAMAKRIEAQQSTTAIVKDLPETMFDYTELGTWFEKARASISTDGVSK